MSDPVDELSALSPSGHDIDDWRRERIRAAAHAELAHDVGAARAWDRYIEPALLIAVCAGSLVWAFRAAAFVLVG